MSTVLDDKRQVQKRLGRKDMHTDIEALQKQKPKLLDPEDQDAVEV